MPMKSNKQAVRIDCPDRLRGLDEERRVLYLVSSNIDPKRSYTRTMTQLSSLGFEDLE